MRLDVRVPVGLLFVLVGVVLTLAGTISDRTHYPRSIGINVNLVWGAVLIAFGAVLLLLARRGRQA